MRTLLAATLGILLLLAPTRAEPPASQSPLIEGYGGVAPVPNAAEFPRRNAKVVFDIVSSSDPEEVNRGLESVARYLNLHAQAGHGAENVRIALVLHGGATRCALEDSAYAKATGEAANPNLPLVRILAKHRVEVFVCGQSLIRQKHSLEEVDPTITIATSAMTVNVNKQLDGYAYLFMH